MERQHKGMIECVCIRVYMSVYVYVCVCVCVYMSKDESDAVLSRAKESSDSKKSFIPCSLTIYRLTAPPD